MDIRANLEEIVTLKPLERKLIPTGLFIELPEGYEAQIRPRSGLALNEGLGLLNSPGTLDYSYFNTIFKLTTFYFSKEIAFHKNLNKVFCKVTQRRFSTIIYSLLYFYSFIKKMMIIIDC